MNLGGWCYQKTTKSSFKPSLVTLEALSTRFTLSEAGQYTIGVFRIKLVKRAAGESTVYPFFKRHQKQHGALDKAVTLVYNAAQAHYAQLNTTNQVDDRFGTTERCCLASDRRPIHPSHR